MNTQNQPADPNSAAPRQSTGPSIMKWVLIGVGIFFGGSFMLVAGLVMLAVIGAAGSSGQARFDEISKELANETVEVTPVSNSVASPSNSTRADDTYDPFNL